MILMFKKRTMHGAYFAIATYIFWGLVPIYFKLLEHVSPWEIVCHRVIWSVILLLAILIYTGQLDALKVSTGTLRRLLLTSALLSVNWLVFIVAIVSNNIVETSLGYFINPLVSVLLGVIFLSERLRPVQWVAIIIAASGIGLQLIYYGEIPWMALALAFSFGFYGLIRKNLNLPPVAGLALETMLILPFASAALIWLYLTGDMDFGTLGLSTDALLILGAFVTTLPLLGFAASVTRLSLTAMGLYQYIAPSLSLVVAIVMYKEAFGIDRLITFICIWTALAIFTTETIYYQRKQALQSRQPAILLRGDD